MGLCMFIAADYITPLLLHTPNSIARHGFASFLELAILMGGFTLGVFISIAVFAMLTRLFLSAKDHQRWVAQFENGKARLPFLTRKIGALVIKVCAPRSHNVL